MTVWLFLFSLSPSSFPLLWRLGLSPVNPLAAAAGDSVTGLRRARGAESGFSSRRWTGKLASERAEPGALEKRLGFLFRLVIYLAF